MVGKIARYYVAESPSGDVCLPVNPVLGVRNTTSFGGFEEGDVTASSQADLELGGLARHA